MRTLAAVLAVAALALTACGGTDEPVAAPSPTPTSTAPTALPTATAQPTPDDGACYQLSYDEAVAPTGDDTTRACADDHTAETFAVGTLDDVVAGHLLAVDSARVQDAVASTCPAQLPDFVGGTADQLRLSMVQTVWFTPTVQDSDAGADWYTCDAVVLAGAQDLATVKGSLKGVLDTTAGRAAYAMCGTDEPGSSDFTKVLCSDDSATWKALSVVAFDRTAADAYPGVDAAKARGQQTCKDAGRAVAPDPLTYRWAYAWPTADDWASGQTYGTCWAPV